MNKSLYILVFLLTCGVLSAQNKGDFLFKGQVISKDRRESVPFASVSIVSKNKGVATSPQGNFDFRISVGDSIRISSVGYADNIFVVTSDMAKSGEIVIIELAPKAIDLDDVEVFQLSENFYLRRKVPDTLKLDLPANLMDLPIQGAPSNYVPPPSGLVSFPIATIPIFQEISRNPKQARIIRRMEEASTFKTQRALERLKYFNKDVVKKVTRIDDRVIDEFMNFCQFLDGEIIGKSDYEIAQKILKRYQAFLKR